jgi:hypothetical protein
LVARIYQSLGDANAHLARMQHTDKLTHLR